MPEGPDMSQKLIQCADHKWAPWSIVCGHLLQGKAKDWNAVPQEGSGEAMNDWLCSKCLKRLPDVPVEDLHAICIHCVRKLQARKK
jgi:hypothetical protein